MCPLVVMRRDVVRHFFHDTTNNSSQHTDTEKWENALLQYEDGKQSAHYVVGDDCCAQELTESKTRLSVFVPLQMYHTTNQKVR